MNPKDQAVRDTVLEVLRRDVAKSVPSLELTDEVDLLTDGVYDSLGFVDLLVELETRMGREIDLSEHSPENYTRVAGLIAAITEVVKDDENLGL